MDAAAFQITELDMHAEAARALLKIARLDAKETVAAAVGAAQIEIATAASEARDVLKEERE
jgi:hypothetical protein